MTVRAEIVETLRRPQRLLKVFDARSRRRLRAVLTEGHFLRELHAPWEEGDAPFVRRVYRDYATYVRHQRSKLLGMETWIVEQYDPQLRAALAERIAKLEIVSGGESVLCLAARIGSEVKAFRDLGCFAVGIDLNPGIGREYVLEGDFHDLRFPDGCVDIVFSNSVDHVFDLDRFSGEVRRVLKPGGALFVELPRDMAETSAGRWESFAWRSVDDLVRHFEGFGFKLDRQDTFVGFPWEGGDSLLFRRDDDDAAAEFQ